jgi:hypothetical protein
MVHVAIFMPIWYILWSFGIVSPVLVRCVTKNLATLVQHVVLTLN